MSASIREGVLNPVKLGLEGKWAMIESSLHAFLLGVRL
jgi:hypothetical protein